MQIDFNGIIKPYKKGDGLWISQGENSKHKVLIEKGKHVELILFESEDYKPSKLSNDYLTQSGTSIVVRAFVSNII